MKRLAAGIAALFLFCLMTVNCFALTYEDDFSDSTNNNIKTYTNLASRDLRGTGVHDITAFSFASTSSPVGWAIYRVQNAERVTVGLYTLNGSFYMQENTTDGKWFLGIGGSPASIQGRTFPQASYCVSTGAVYATINNHLQTVYEDSSGNHVFSDLGNVRAPGELIGYGVNVYTSSDGRSWSRINLTQTSIIYTGGEPYFYEELSGAIPSRTMYVKVELNDFTRIPILGTDQYSHKTNITHYNSLAIVALSGADLLLGLPEPEVSEPVDRSEVEEGSSSRAASSRAATATTKSSAAAASTASSSKYSSAKFEGVIEASKASKKSAAPSSKASAAASAKEPSAAEPAPDASAEEVYRYVQADAVYQIPSKNNDDITFTVGITAYIIIMTALIAFVVIKSIGKRQ